VPVIYLDDSAKSLDFDRIPVKDIESENLSNFIKARLDDVHISETLVEVDRLTGFTNYKNTLKNVDHLIKKATREHSKFSMILLSVNNFQRLGDTYGYQAQDKVLLSLSLIIKNRIRINDTVGRYDPNSFLITLHDATKDQTKEIIDYVRKKYMSVNYSIDNQIFNASFTAGIAAFPEYQSRNELIDAALNCLGETGSSGKGAVEVAGKDSNK